MTTKEMSEMGLTDIPLTADEVRTAILALHEAEEIYLRRAARYREAGFSANHADCLKRAGKAQALANWVAHHADAE